MTSLPITGRCYCGAISIYAAGPPLMVTYCHCADCRRATGAPVAAFAAFAEGDVKFEPDDGRRSDVSPGVARSFCTRCGSPIAGRYEYLQGQVHVAIGLLDQADTLAPEHHAHDSSSLPWLHIDDDLPRDAASAREKLNK